PFEEQFTCRYLCNQLGKTSRVIKVALLDQTIVSGLGNIYVDEVLFRARIHPLKKSNELSESEINAIRKHAIDTLNEAVTKGGTTIRSYVNGQGEMGMFQQELFVYGQESHPCKQCGQTIEKLKVGGRGTHICSNCQKYAHNSVWDEPSWWEGRGGMCVTIGLTGSIAIGDSSVLSMCSDYDSPVRDADKISREVVEPGQDAYIKIGDRFGKGILNLDNTLIRA